MIVSLVNFAAKLLLEINYYCKFDQDIIGIFFLHIQQSNFDYI